MKVCLIGKGKTGGEILNLIPKNKVLAVFDSKNPIDINIMNQADVTFAFVPGVIFAPMIDQLMSCKKPLVIGATGFDWSNEQLQCLKDKNLKWVHGHNFSLGMNIIRNLFAKIQQAQSLLEGASYKIHEEHHTKKLDAPSGTAIKWQQWLGLDDTQVEITAHREGDIIGIHELTILNEIEKIQIRHESLDRKLFAKGAIWAADKLLTDPTIPNGLIQFDELVDRYINN